MSQSKIERATLRLPSGFNPTTQEQALRNEIAKKLPGFELDSIDLANGVAHVSKQTTITKVVSADDRGGKTFELSLQRGTKPADGDKYADRFEDTHEGYTMTTFEPFRGFAVMTRLSPDEIRARGAIAGALSVKPWDVQVASRKGGGFTVGLPASYVPSRHKTKLEEVASVVIGRPGWYVNVNTRELTAEIIPGELPTFPAAYPYPFDAPTNDPFSIPIGYDLGGEGRPNMPLDLRLSDSAGGLIQGLAGSGKLAPIYTALPVSRSERFPDGWATVGELEVGDLVFAGDGTPVPVAGFSDTVEREVYEVHLSDGQVLECGPDHLWRVSSAVQRWSGKSRAAGDVRHERTLQQAAALDEAAHDAPAGAVVSAPDLAAMTGLPYHHVLDVVQAAGLAKNLEQRLVVRAGATRQNKATEYPAARALAALGAPVEVTAEWMTPRELGEVLGAAGMSQNNVQRKLRQANVPGRKTSRPVQQPGSPAMLPVEVYPLGEALAALADARRALASGWHAPSASWTLKTAAELADDLRQSEDGSHAKWSIELPATGIQTPHVDLPVDPYVLGAWLGDGTSSGGGFTGIDAEITDAICDAGHKVSHYSEPKAHHIHGLTKGLRAAGVLRDKHIPAAYLRASREQRLALLQGLMDTDGTIGRQGACEFAVVSAELALGVLELVRSLGIKASMTEGEACITEADPDNPGASRRRRTNTRFRVRFTTDQQVFRLSRKLARLPKPGTLRATQGRVYIVDVKATGRFEQMRCLRLDHPDHLYLTDGFIPTHNSVAVNALVYGLLARGHEVAILDVPHKAVDFEWCKPFVREHGWGGESTAAAVAVAQLVYTEGRRRGQVLRRHGAQKWQDLPAHVRKDMPIITLVVDELTGLFATDPIPKSLPKDHPVRLEAEQAAAERDLLKSVITKIPAEMRAAGIRLVMATQQAQSNTGIPPSVKINLPNRVLLGTNATKQARTHAFANPDAMPQVPEWIVEDAKAAKGVGVAEFEGQTATVFKAYYAPTDEYLRHLEELGVRRATNPEPTAEQIAQFVPRLSDDADDDERPASRLDSGGWGEVDGRDAPAPVLRGAARASHELAVEAARAARDSA